MARTKNIFIDQGASFEESYIAYDKLDQVIDLTDYNIRAQMKKTFIAYRAIDFVIEVVDAVNGHFKIKMLPETSDVLRGGRYLYDIELEHGVTGDVIRVYEGLAVLNPQITGANPFATVDGLNLLDTGTLHSHDNLDSLNSVFAKPWTAVSSDYAMENGDRIFADTSAGIIELTLPPSPEIGHTAEIVDMKGTFATNKVILKGGAENISGQPLDVDVDDSNINFRAVYTGDVAIGWKLLF